MTDVPNWLWLVPVVLVGVLRPRLVFGILRGVIMLGVAVLLAIFAGVCL